MKLIFKNFISLLKRFKTSSVLNIIGLSVAFAVFTVITIQVHYDFTYDCSFKKVDNIYQYSLYFLNGGDGGDEPCTTVPIGERIASKCPEVKNYCLSDLKPRAINFDLQNDNGPVSKSFNLQTCSVSPGFLDVFTPKILFGDPKEALSTDNKLLIPRSVALRLFGTANAVGKVMYTHYNKTAMTVKAVYEDFPQNSTMKNCCYKYLKNWGESQRSYFLYLELAPNTREQLVKKLLNPDILGEATTKSLALLPPQLKVAAKLTPLKDVHLYLKGARDGNINLTLSLLAIGALILIIAFINLLNISMAMVPSRVKTLNMYKIMGAESRQLRTALAMEGPCLAFISFLLALLYIYIFSMSTLASFFAANISLAENKLFIIIIGFFLLLVSYLINLYPAIYATTFKVATSLKGSFSLSAKAGSLRNTLITIQLTVSIILIVLSCFIKLQQDYVQNYDWGIQKENIIYLPIDGLKSDYKTFGDEVQRNPNVLAYTASWNLPGSLDQNWGRIFEGQEVHVAVWPVVPNFPQFFGIKILAGNDFLNDNVGAIDQLIVNQKFLKKYQFDNSIIGKSFGCFDTKGVKLDDEDYEGRIVGIMKDVNFASLHDPIDPMAFVIFNDKSFLKYVFIKISGDVPTALNQIKQTWEKFSNEDFNPTFLDSRMNELYKSENNLGKLIGLFSLVTLLITIMGIYGLISFNTRYKRKEISICKINGASESEMIMMLNKNLFTQLFIAFVVAVPLSYYIVNKWLENFAYKIPIYWWVFALAGLLVLLISTATVSIQSWRAATTNPVDALKNE